MPTVEDLKSVDARRALHVDVLDERARDFFHQAGEKQRLLLGQGKGFGEPVGRTSVDHVATQGPGGTAKAEQSFGVSEFTPQERQG